MKILRTQPTNDILFGLYAALEKVNNNILVFGQSPTIYQILDKTPVDLIMCEAQDLTPITLEAIKEFNIPTIVFGISVDFPQKKLTVLLQSIPEKILNNINGPVHVMKSAAHAIDTDSVLDFDVLYIDESSDYNRQVIETIGMLSATKLQMKVVGPIKLPFVEYVGNVTYKNIIELIKSAKIVIIQSNTYLYDVLANNKFVITQMDNSIIEKTKESELLELIKHFIEQPKHRESEIKNMATFVGKSTYEDRLKEIFEIVGIKICN